MKKLVLKYFPVFLIAFFFYAMLDTSHSRSLGDIIFEWVGIPAWTHGYQGTHISIFVFLFFIMTIFYIRNKYIEEALIIRGKQHFVIFLILVTVMFFIHSGYVEAKRGSFDDLRSIALNDDCIYSYCYYEGEFREFEYEFELTNYGTGQREFEIVLETDEVGNQAKRFLTDRDMTYTLAGKETRVFRFTLEDLDPYLETETEAASFSGKGWTEHVVLRDVLGNEYVIFSLKHNGIIIGR